MRFTLATAGCVRRLRFMGPAPTLLASSKSWRCALFSAPQAEEIIEEWWEGSEDAGFDFEGLEKHLCHAKLGLCCDKGAFGPKCKPCPGGAASPCGGHGICNGDSVRAGSGKCSCDTGYKGKACADCKAGAPLLLGLSGIGIW